MADREYTVVYKGNNSDWVSKAGVILRILKLLDVASDAVKGKLRNLFGASAQDAGKASAGFKKAATSLNAVTTSATKSETALSGVSIQAAMAASRLGELQGSLSGIGGSLKSIQTHTAGAGHSMGAFIAASLGIRSVIDLIKELGDGFKKLREELEAMGNEAITVRDSMREVAMLRGHSGPDDEVTAGTVAFGLKAGMMPAEAAEYMEQYLGSSPAGKEKGHITDKVSEEVAAEGARFGVRAKLDPKTSGDFSGIISQYHKIDSVEDAAKIEGQVLYGLTEGRGKSEALLKAMLSKVGAVVDEDAGAVKSLPDYAAAFGVASTHASPERAGTQLNKSITGLRHTSGEWGESLAKIGIDPTQDYFEAMDKLAPVILAGDKVGPKGEKPRGADTVLREMGLTDETELRSHVQIAREWDLIQKRRKAQSGDKEGKTVREKEGITGKSVMAETEKYHTTDLSGINRKVDATNAAARYVKGHKMEKMIIAKKAAYARMLDDGRLTDVDNVVRDKALDALTLTGMLGLPSHEEQRVNDEAIEHLEREAIEAGISPSDPMLSKKNPDGSTRAWADRFNTGVVEKTLEKKPGSEPLGGAGGVSAKLRSIARSKALKDRDEAMKGPHAAPVKVAPPGGVPVVVPVAGAPGAGGAAAGPPGAGVGPLAMTGDSGRAAQNTRRQQLDVMNRMAFSLEKHTGSSSVSGSFGAMPTDSSPIDPTRIG